VGFIGKDIEAAFKPEASRLRELTPASGAAVASLPSAGALPACALAAQPTRDAVPSSSSAASAAVWIGATASVTASSASALEVWCWNLKSAGANHDACGER
jgi:hypothetical protein